MVTSYKKDFMVQNLRKAQDQNVSKIKTQQIIFLGSGSQREISFMVSKLENDGLSL